MSCPVKQLGAALIAAGVSWSNPAQALEAVPEPVGTFVGDDVPVMPRDLRRCVLLRPPAAVDAATSYTVQPGDTLSGVSLGHYGAAWAIDEIREYNNRHFRFLGHDTRLRYIPESYRIYPGQMIPLPPRALFVNEALANLSSRPLGAAEEAPITISGSGTLYPVAVAISQCYDNADLVNIPGVPRYYGKIRVEGEGTFYGMRHFCAGDAEIVTASDRLLSEAMAGRRLPAESANH